MVDFSSIHRGLCDGPAAAEAPASQFYWQRGEMHNGSESQRGNHKLRNHMQVKGETNMKRNIWLSAIVACLLVGLTSVSEAAFTAGMTQQFKNNALTAVLVTGSPTVYFALGLQSANTSVGPGTTVTSSFTALASSHGYATATLGTCSVASTGSTFYADYNCASPVFTSTDGTGFSADCGMLYYSTVPVAFYTWTTATASGNGGTITVTMPTVAVGTRGVISISQADQPERYIVATGLDGKGVYLVPVYHLG